MAQAEPSARMDAEAADPERQGLALARAADEVAASWAALAQGAPIIWEDAVGVPIRAGTADAGREPSHLWSAVPILAPDGPAGAVRCQRGPLTDGPPVPEPALAERTAVVAAALGFWGRDEAHKRGESIRRGLQDASWPLSAFCRRWGEPCDAAGDVLLLRFDVGRDPKVREAEALRRFLVPRLWRYAPDFPLVMQVDGGLGAVLPVGAPAGSAGTLQSWHQGWLRRGGTARLAIVRLEVAAKSAVADVWARTDAILQLARRRGDAGLVAEEAGDLLSQLLLAEPVAALERFRATVLGELLAPRHRELLETLAVYLDAGRSPRDAAQRLHVHPNTLRYRLHRAEKLLGGSIGDTGEMAALFVALQAQMVLGGLPARAPRPGRGTPKAPPPTPR